MNKWLSREQHESLSHLCASDSVDMRTTLLTSEKGERERDSETERHCETGKASLISHPQINYVTEFPLHQSRSQLELVTCILCVYKTLARVSEIERQ